MYKYLGALWLLLVAQVSWADTALWEVSKGDHKFWLGASLSGLKSSSYPLPAEFDDAFRRADKLYVERDISAVSQSDFGVRAMQASVYSDGRNLKSALSPAVWNDLEKFAQARGVPMFSLLLFKPVFTVFTLTALESKRLELRNGVDAHYFYRAAKLQKPIVVLETLEQQISYLQKINEIDANLLIKNLLEELSGLSSSLDQITQSWRAGDMEALDRLKGKKLRAQAPELYKILVMERSQSWLPYFNNMLKTTDVEFVLIDAIHFSGLNNLLQLLKAEGYTVKPYKL